jgi:hypothetical protein
MHMTFKLALLHVCLVVSINTFAQAPNLSVEGEYTRPTRNCFATLSDPSGIDCGAPLEEGVEIKARSKTSFYIWLKTRGADGNFCEYAGIARWRKDELISKSKDCVIKIVADGNTASFSSDGEGCYRYCGSKATLDAGKLKRKNRLTNRSTGPARKAAQAGYLPR